MVVPDVVAVGFEAVVPARLYIGVMDRLALFPAVGESASEPNGSQCVQAIRILDDLALGCQRAGVDTGTLEADFADDFLDCGNQRFSGSSRPESFPQSVVSARHQLPVPDLVEKRGNFHQHRVGVSGLDASNGESRPPYPVDMKPVVPGRIARKPSASVVFR